MSIGFEKNCVCGLGARSKICRKRVKRMAMDDWTKLLFNGSGIATGVIAGIVAAAVQFIISHLDHAFITKNRKAEQVHRHIEWQRNEIGNLIREVSAIKVPTLTETNEDTIENAYHLIIADFERAKPLLYEKSDDIRLRGFFATLDKRYNQMQQAKLGYGVGLSLENSKIVVIEEIKECKQRLLKVLQEKEEDILSQMI